MTQNEMILQYIKDFGSITPLEALADLGIMRLASRISDLKMDGHKIKKRDCKRQKQIRQDYALRQI